MRMRFVGLLGVFLLLGCSGSGSPSGSASPSASLSASPCPVADAAACARLAAGVAALTGGDVAAVRALSFEETFDCATTPVDVVPTCRPGQVLTGYGRFSVAGRIEVIPAASYDSRVGAWLATDPVSVLGVGTCGPADPTRRSYHLAFETGDRLGSLEFVLRESRWSVGVLYLDTVAEWRKEHDDPSRDIACGNIRPWG